VQRRPALLALIALSAALAFGVGATAVADLDPPTVGGGPVNATNGSAGASAGGGAGSGGSGGSAPLGAVGGIYGVVAGLLPAVDPLVLLAAAGLVVAGLALAGLRRRRDESDDRPVPDATVAASPTDDGTSHTAVPETPADNEVYRAWREMRERVDVTYGKATTPREFARDAVAAGADAEPVERLTDLFDRVRYGDAAPTDERERAARDALDALDDGGED
jgi:hypothetical protein